MKKMKRFFAVAGIFLLAANVCHSKDTNKRIPIAIVDFIAARGLSQDAGSIAASVQELLTNEFSNRRDEFRILDRSAMGPLLKEVETEHGADFINSPNLVSEGRLTGAKFIATGIITLFNKNAAVGNSVATAQLSFSLKIIDLETGESKISRVITEESGYGGDPTTSILAKVQADLSTLMLNVFPPTIRIARLAEADSVKGKVTKVLLNKGEETFFPTKEKIIIGTKLVFPKLVVIRREIINTGTGDMVNDVTIAELSMDKLQGQFSVWNVSAKDHGKAILESYKSGALNQLIVKPE